MGYYVNPSAESFAAIARSKSGFYQYCKSNIKQKKIQGCAFFDGGFLGARLL